MILLHHPEVELSRTLLTNLPDGVEVVDWSVADTANWGGPQPSALPSVVVDVPAYGADQPQFGPDGEFLGMGRVTVPASLELLRMPASWEAVGEYVAHVENRARLNPAL
ncbi:MAG: hypothetical protein Q7U56_05795 [Humidesulfovibrio sp.]|nr:hypothetical protein [Humidesulfovibrio sp.]